eukprot:CAMPEP_0170541256 /NCGR_PEP_ID=MMETSP0211-20121228/1033_1 /TAXON_ID=311385 /ORGANISM="Pseudokeronopsis sp., Strain OXSARD2" /LENGTH=48 /DNA_ID= /DNA_START= /DNA_END= /DNA_ORIENTATION=
MRGWDVRDPDEAESDDRFGAIDIEEKGLEPLGIEVGFWLKKEAMIRVC